MGYQEAAVLSSLRISKTVNALVDPRLVPGDLRFLKRTPIVPTSDYEIIGRVLNQVLTADIIADDQASHVYAAQRVKFELNHVPKIKIGISMTENMIQLYQSIANSSSPNSNDVQAFGNYQQTSVKNVLRGVQQRMEALIVAMNCDQVSPTYSRLGIQFGNGLSWGMWSDLKGVSAYAWTDPTNSTPVDDLLALKLVGSARYGKNYDRVTMSTPAFRLMIATANFQSRAKLYIPAQLVGGAYSSYFSLANLQQQQAFAQNVLGMDIELYDTRHPQPSTAGGAPVYTPYLPLNLVVLSEKANDNNENVMDWGNTMPTETLMNQAPGIIGGGFPQPAYGPVAYAALADSRLDPAGYIYYGVARGFPRKFDQAATSVLNIGTVSDPISATLQF